MRSTDTTSIKDLHFSNHVILQNTTLKNLKGGIRSLEQYAKVDEIKCENAFRKAERINGDGLW